jgi:hypothetical protein
MRQSLGTKQRHQAVGHFALMEGLQKKNPVGEKGQGDHVGCMVVAEKKNKSPEDSEGILGNIKG